MNRKVQNKERLIGELERVATKVEKFRNSSIIICVDVVYWNGHTFARARKKQTIASHADT